MGNGRATGKCGGGTQAGNNIGWGWKGCLWRDLASLNVGKSFWGARKEEGAARLGRPQSQGRRGAEQGVGAPRRFCK